MPRPPPSYSMKEVGPAILMFAALAVLGVWLVPSLSPFPISRLQAVELIAFGVAVGAYGTMVGAGGGFLIVPVLLLAWRLPPAQAAGTSLLVVFLNATAGSVSYARQGRIDVRSGLWLAVATLPGAVAGAFLAEYVSGRAFDIAFAVLLIGVAGLLIWRPVSTDVSTSPTLAVGDRRWWRVEREFTDNSGQVFRYRYNLRSGIALSFVVGFLSSILGIGGGIIHVPALIHLLGFPAHIATATSQFILAISAAVGAATHFSLGNILFGPAILMGIGVISGAQIGAKMARRMKGAMTVRLLSVALIVVALRLLLR